MINVMIWKSGCVCMAQLRASCVWVNVVSHVCEKELSCGLSRLEVIEGVKEWCTVYSVQCSVQCSESVVCG